MSPGERAVWAAAYASEWCRAREDFRTMAVESNPAAFVESAWGAVYDMRHARDGVIDGFGEGDEVLTMLDEMLGET